MQERAHNRGEILSKIFILLSISRRGPSALTTEHALLEGLVYGLCVAHCLLVV